MDTSSVTPAGFACSRVTRVIYSVPREQRRATRAVDKSNRVERYEFSCFRSIYVSIATTSVRIRDPRAPSGSSSPPPRRQPPPFDDSRRNGSSGRGTLFFHLKRLSTDLTLYLRRPLLEWDRHSNGQTETHVILLWSACVVASGSCRLQGKSRQIHRKFVIHT